MKKILVVGAILLTIAMLAYVVFGNQKKEAQKIDPAFTGYVAGFTSGVISKDAEIVVHLREEVALEKQNEDILSNIFWHIDDEFVLTTNHFHQIEVAPTFGSHTLTIVDENGETIIKSFSVIK